MQRPLIDAHVHLNTTSTAKMKMALEQGAYFLSINTDIPCFPSLCRQEKAILELQKAYPGRVLHITSFDSNNWNSPGWAQQAIDQIQHGLDHGAVGVKIWKNFGMDPRLKDEKGHFVMIDDERLHPIFEFIQDNGILLVGHQGEPRNCWLPIKKMTVHSDRSYFAAHPEYHMYLHPGYPSYEEQIRARDRFLDKFSDINFVGLHLLSLEWELDEVDKRLDKYPRLMTDLAERVCHVQLQAQQDREKVRRFFLKHQDRIIYGTDVIDDGSTSELMLNCRFQKLWQEHYDFFATDKMMHTQEFEGTFRGLQLPEPVVRKIFLDNAVKTYGFKL